MKIDDLKLGEPLFAILPLPGTDQFVVVYPDRTFEILAKADVKSDYDQLLALREGTFESIEDLREGIVEVKNADEDEDEDDDSLIDDEDEELGGRGDFFNSSYKPAARNASKPGSFDVSTEE